MVYDPKFRFWRVPGGRVEAGEKEEETVRREIPEELGIEITVERYLGDGQDDVPIYGVPGKDKTSRNIRYYECRISSGTPTKKEKGEVAEIRWMSLEEIKKIADLEPAMRDYFSKSNIK